MPTSCRLSEASLVSESNLLSPSEQEKDQEDQGGDEKWRLPLRKPLHRNILDFPGSSEAASVDRNESEAADQILNGFFGGMDISGVVNLAQESFNFRVVLKRSIILYLGLRLWRS